MVDKYAYRRLSPAQQEELVRQRRSQGLPFHSPPHLVRNQANYFITAACHNHTPRMATAKRRQQVLDLLFEAFSANRHVLRGWVILPTHYHLLVEVSEFATIGTTLRAVHGPTARMWNREDDTAGRKVWYRFMDRAIRSEGHFYVSLNYIHYNPVKHKCVDSPYAWTESSVHWYLEHFGRDWLQDSWERYPVFDYGRSWD